MSRILLIDDSEVLNHLVREFLESHGYEMDTAANAEEAYQAIKRKKPDLMLLDIQLPDINGFELCKHFRSRSDTRQIPIILISATATQTLNKVQGLQSGADDYLTKPLEMEELLERIRAVMRRKGSLQATGADSNQTPSNNPPLPTSYSEGEQPLDEGSPNSIFEAVSNTLCSPFSLPVEPPPVTLMYLIAMTLLVAMGLSSASGMSLKPLMVCLTTLITWGFLVSVLVISCSLKGIDLKWKAGADLFSLAALPILLKLAGGAILAAWTTLSPLLFSASPALFFPSAPWLLNRIDLFEIWSVILIALWVRTRPGATPIKAAGIALMVWVSAIVWLFCIQRLGGGL